MTPPTKEWCMNMAKIEGNQEIGAGLLPVPTSASPYDCAALQVKLDKLPEILSIQDRLTSLAEHLESLDSESGEAKMLRHAATYIDALESQVDGLQDA